MSNLNELLRQLSEIEPEVCRRAGNCYLIGDYEFQVEAGELWASLEAIACTGDPARAWLQGALQAEIARRGWSLRTLTLTDGGNSVIIANRFESEWFPLMVEALLTAFIAACEAAK